MVRLSVFYPNIEGKKFDKDYYLQVHMPLTLNLQGPFVKSVQVDFGTSGTPGTRPPFVATCHFTYDSYQAFESAFMPHADTLMKDIANYTDIESLIQFSDIVLNQ